MAETIIYDEMDVGAIGMVYVGPYSESESYEYGNVVTTEDSSYCSAQDGNVGHALTDTEWWIPMALGTSATAAAKKATEATTDAATATSEAKTATSQATKAAGKAQQAVKSVETALQNLSTQAQECTDAAASAEAVTQTATEKIYVMDALIKSYSIEAQAAPIRMEVDYPETISVKNKVAQRIVAQLYPTYVMQNVLYQREEGTSLRVNPSGELSVKGEGATTFYIIPPQHTALWQEVTITVRPPRIRLTGSGKIRLNGGRMRIV
jgi:hypothetical protein